MITRRQIRAKVMQAVYACITSGQQPAEVFNLLLREIKDELEELEKKKKLSGDTKLLSTLYYDSMENATRYDQLIKSKAQNWELDRIAKIDRILMHMAICEMLNFEEIPIKVTINEYLELAKAYSTPKSSKFINGILDSLYNDFKHTGRIVKRGRGLIDTSSAQQPVESE
ncbi:transcription antitermination factor NusB [Pontibacter sp. G13]|uniref:transcription antitermination factor NusB n=1 Tax=Pontibacter sp. G13 TaxID=3074898 RepID=UPI00288B3A09|nr:transcription antitermination factor NusB [Pontibacter sp. G13]WNJ18038.1 transcription antitermination factor NusB [Pontibacter sp. G13]